jgi:rare lipoprotein A
VTFAATLQAPLGLRSWPVLCAALALLLIACSTTRPRQAQPARTSGGYYLDDGPAPNPPPNLDRTPDAQPRAEPIKASTTRPYTVMGRTYTPMAAPGPYRAQGIASWYGKRYHGQPTASGEMYDMFAMTAAHPILPIPSYARVTNLGTGKSVVVRINDRGPFRSDRLIDLSYVAAWKLGVLDGGSTRVEVRSLIPGDTAVAVAQRPLPAATVEPAAASFPPSPPLAPGFYVQLGAFGMRDNAEAFARRVRAEIGDLPGLLNVFTQGSVYRVQAGPFSLRRDALGVASRVEAALGVRPVVVSR